MTVRPDISVVMSVYNGAASLRETVDSVLLQKGVSFEFIIVDDGSTDQSSEILREYARADTRVKIIRQENQGLTKALITGCAAAQGRYIARQDAGDVSLPGRLKLQSEVLAAEPATSFVSCGTLFIGPDGERLYEERPAATDLTESLLTFELDKIKGPSMHGATMFPKRKYEQVGGYRASFHFAQDLDLWIRLAEIGKHRAVQEVLYQASFTIGSISGRYRKHQLDIARLILESAQRRRSGKGEGDVLRRASIIKPDVRKKFGRQGRADALYFIGACLRQSGSPGATDYFRRALMTYPLHVRSAVRLLFG